MRSLENLEYSFVIRELQAAVGKYFSNVYRIAEGKYRLKVGDIQFIIEPGRRLNLAKFIEEPGEPDHLVNLMKQRLDNAKLVSVEQVNGDRLVVFTFDSRPVQHRLVLEGFGKGNLILVSEDKTIVAMREEEWSDRAVKHNQPYAYPKSNTVNDWQSALSEKYVITALLKLPLGKEYSKEILARCGIDEKKQGTSLVETEVKKINAELAKLLSSIEPLAFFDKDLMEDFGLVRFSKYKNIEARSVPSLSEIIDEYFLHHKEKKSERLVKLERRLEEQKERLVSLQSEAKEIQLIVDEAYGKYGELETVLVEGKKHKLEEVESKLGKYNAKLKDKKRKEIEVEL